MDQEAYEEIGGGLLQNISYLKIERSVLHESFG